MIRWLKNRLSSKKPVGTFSKKDIKKIDSDAIDIVHSLKKAGYETYLVGGCVRDLLLGNTPKDYDIATAAPPQQIKANVKRSTIIGKRFRIVLARRHDRTRRESYDYCPNKLLPIKPKEFEITTFRRKPEVMDGKLNENVFGTPKEDALRRDFTLNALLLDPQSGKIFDFVDAQSDFANKTIRVIGDAKERFLEDPVRILRALRFHVRTGFKLCQKEQKAFNESIPEVSKAKKERTREEILKSFRENYAAPFISEINNKGIWPYINPLYAKLIEDKDTQKRIVQLATFCDQNPWPHPLMMTPFFFVLLFRQVLSGSLSGDGFNEIAHNFRMSNAEKDGLKHLSTNLKKLKGIDLNDEKNLDKFFNHLKKHPEDLCLCYYALKALAAHNAKPYATIAKATKGKFKAAIDKIPARDQSSRRGRRPGRRRRPPSGRPPSGRGPRRRRD